MTRAPLLLCLGFTALAFSLGIDWGLPSRAGDRFLFGQRAPWTGAQILELTGGRPPAAAADVDRDPLESRRHPTLLNATDRDRAAIVLRYRLYSAQPDEMITFMALSQMDPRRGRFDPGLYQYGGLWVYGVGAVLAGGQAVGLVDLRGDLGFYLDNPQAFGRFYVAARMYSAGWGVAGAWAVWWLTRRMSGSALASAAATVGFALLPVVVTMAHEAKPHLPAASLMLLACVASVRFVETGRKRWWIGSAGLCGASVGMILSAWPVALVVPVMLLARKMPWSGRLVVALASGVIAIDVYLLTNPYVLRHALSWNRAENPLRANLDNSRAMYRATLSAAGVGDAGRLFAWGATPVVGVLGAIGAVGLLYRRGGDEWAAEPPREEGLAMESRRAMEETSDIAGTGAIAGILLAPSALILVQFALLAEGKPGEYARFALFPAVTALIFAVAGAWRMGGGGRWAVVVLALMLARVGVGGASYLWHFINDRGERPTRLIAAERLQALNERGARSLLLRAEPAPYSVPPVDLWRWQVWLAGRGDGGAMDADVTIEARDHHSTGATSDENRVRLHWVRPRLLPTPISWAGKPLEVHVALRFVPDPPRE